MTPPLTPSPASALPEEDTDYYYCLHTSEQNRREIQEILRGTLPNYYTSMSVLPSENFNLLPSRSLIANSFHKGPPSRLSTVGVAGLRPVPTLTHARPATHPVHSPFFRPSVSAVSLVDFLDQVQTGAGLDQIPEKSDLPLPSAFSNPKIVPGHVPLLPTTMTEITDMDKECALAWDALHDIATDKLLFDPFRFSPNMQADYHNEAAVSQWVKQYAIELTADVLDCLSRLVADLRHRDSLPNSELV